MKVIITGGAGFIGSNAASHYLSQGDDVVIFDNLSRQNTDKNLAWLKGLDSGLTFIRGDLRSLKDTGKLTGFLKGADAILHLAAQVAVTTSVINPREDFEINALGTFNLLEAMRAAGAGGKLIYSSTNKVYGAMEDIKVVEEKTRYSYADLTYGIGEDRQLDFHSPYGCSKGAAEQYIHDYGRIYGLDTVVFRQSCIYGPRQFGVEDQGWVAWFMIAVALGKPITIYGDGKQVRDLLYVDDLMRAYDMAITKKAKTRGKIYNIGGGHGNTLSVWTEFRPILEKYTGTKIRATFKSARKGDQKIFISDNRKAYTEFGWMPQTDIKSGLQYLYSWIGENKKLFVQ